MIQQVDFETFVYLAYQYAKDKNNVYQGGISARMIK